MNDRRVQWIYDLIDTIISIIRLIFQRSFLKKTIAIHRNHDQCILMGNGPSLSESLSENSDKLNKYDLVAVNFMALSEEYFIYKPNLYILCDPAFWYETGTKAHVIQRVNLFYDVLIHKTEWNLQIYLPVQAKRNTKIKELIHRNKNVTFNFYNKTKFEGLSSLNYFIYNKQWGMPRPQNVLVATFMLAIYSGYKRIYLLGAENDWLKNMRVDNNNQVSDKFKHFYRDDKKTQSTHWGGESKLHNALLTLSQMFKSYVDVEAYAKKRNQKIYNSTPDSFIDAFERKPID